VIRYLLAIFSSYFPSVLSTGSTAFHLMAVYPIVRLFTQNLYR
jgi:hypothetical protein